MNAPEDPRIGELEDKLRLAEHRADDMRRERDEARALVSRMEDQVRDSRDLIDRWIEAFDMERGEDGNWQVHSPHLIDDWNDLVEKYNALLKDWNRFVPDYNAKVDPKPVGRPLAASEAQQAAVRKFRKRGMSIRNIVIETNLGMQTVRSILDRDAMTDRASKRLLAKIDYKPVRAMLISARSRRRTRDALPRAIDEIKTESDKLLKDAKGLS
jgi:hypothetical protein